MNEPELTRESLLAAHEEEQDKRAKLSKKGKRKYREAIAKPEELNKALTATLAKRFPPSVIADKLHEMLSATIESQGGQIRDDTRTQLAAVVTILNYTVGTPVQRQEVVSVNVDTSIEELQSQVDMSPALKARLAKMAGATLPDVVEVETEEG